MYARLAHNDEQESAHAVLDRLGQSMHGRCPASFRVGRKGAALSNASEDKNG